MRAREFLIEYRRDITLNRFRAGLTAALKRLASSHVDDELYQAHWILSNQKTNPLAKPVTVTVFGDKITISNENMAEVAEQILPKLLERTVEYFERVDPTPQKKYVPWMIQAFINDPNDSRMEDYNGNNLLGLYDRYKSSLRPEHRDINKFKTYGEFVSWIWDYGLQNRAAEKVRERGEFEIVYEDDTVQVIHPIDEQASKFWGRGSIWCTAGENNNRFERYNAAGPLYILLPKKPTYEGEKYQIHVANGEWADEQNDQKNIKLFQTKFPGFIQWLMQHEPELKNAVVFADPDEITELLKIFQEPTMDHVVDVLNNMEMEDDYYQEYLAGEARERGYIDDNDDIDWDKVHDDDDLNYLNYSDSAHQLLKILTEVFKSTGQRFKEFAEELDEESGSMYSLDQFEELLSKAIKQEAEDYSSRRSTNELIGDIREWVHYNFTIYPKNRPPKYDNPRWNLLGSTDNYLVYKSKSDNSR